LFKIITTIINESFVSANEEPDLVAIPTFMCIALNNFFAKESLLMRAKNNSML